MRQRISAGTVLMLMLMVVTLACNVPLTGGGPLSVQIVSPAAGSTVAVDQPATITCSAVDSGGAGVARVELFVNGASTATQQASGGTQASFDTSFMWQPTAEGETQIMVIAYRADGTASAPATIAVNVVGMTSASPTSTTSTEVAEASPSATSQSYVQGEATMQVSIRIRPGPLCDLIGVVEKGEVINLMEYSQDNLWFMTDHLGPEEIGWVYIEPITILGNEEDIPHGDKTGCAGCGDSVCASNENCSTCSQDCGQCCGNGACEGGFGETCSSCTADCGPCPPVCGNGVVETGEQCEGNGQCRRGQTCIRCQCVSLCGNGVCDVGESCTNCTIDCGPC
jgi:hypothetical protein